MITENLTGKEKAVAYAIMDLNALTKAEDWLEIVELQRAARETLDDLETEYPELYNAATNS